MAEQMPPAVRDILVERGCHHRGADVAGAAADQCGLRNPAQLVRVLKVFQAAERLILIRPPAIEIGLGARTLGTTDTFGRVLIDTDHKLLEVMVVGLHGSPRLAEDVHGVEVKMFADGDELVYPGLLCP